MGAVGGTRYQALGDGQVVAEQADAEGGPLVTPGYSCQNDGVEFLPLDTPSELGLSPAAIEPLSLAVGTEADGPRAGGEGQEEEGAAILGSGRSAEVNRPPEEGLASWDHLGCEAEGADEGEELPLGTAGPG